MNEHPVNEPYKPNARETRIQIIKFALFSASAGIIETAAFTVLDMVTPWKYWPCYLIALVLFFSPWPRTLFLNIFTIDLWYTGTA